MSVMQLPEKHDHRRRVEGMATANDDAERSRRRPGRSVTGCRTSANIK